MPFVSFKLLWLGAPGTYEAQKLHAGGVGHAGFDVDTLKAPNLQTLRVFDVLNIDVTHFRYVFVICLFLVCFGPSVFIGEWCDVGASCGRDFQAKYSVSQFCELPGKAAPKTKSVV